LLTEENLAFIESVKETYIKKATRISKFTPSRLVYEPQMIPTIDNDTNIRTDKGIIPAGRLKTATTPATYNCIKQPHLP
jgi:hypothetical protein